MGRPWRLLHFATDYLPLGRGSPCGHPGFQRRFPFFRQPERGWHETRVAGSVLIAVPNYQGRVSPVFDVAARLTLVHLEGEAELERKEAVLFEKQPDRIVRCLVDIGVEVLICGAISDRLEAGVARAGIRVVSHICGQVEAVVAAYRTGTLNSPGFRMPGCCGRRRDGRDRAPRCRRIPRSRAPR